MAFVDRGYRGHGVEDVKVFISGAKRGVTRTIAKLLRRHGAIEPMIGHMKNDGRLRRSTPKGTQGDALFAVLCGCGHNIRMILRHLRTVLHRLIRQICMIIHAEMALCQRDQADKMAEAQPSEDEVMEARAVQWSAQETRARIDALSSNEKAVLRRTWNCAPDPSVPVYLPDHLKHGRRPAQTE